MATIMGVDPLAEYISNQIGVPLNNIKSIQYNAAHDSVSTVTVEIYMEHGHGFTTKEFELVERGSQTSGKGTDADA